MAKPKGKKKRKEKATAKRRDQSNAGTRKRATIEQLRELRKNKENKR